MMVTGVCPNEQLGDLEVGEEAHVTVKTTEEISLFQDLLFHR
jgi:hypothetical protein